MYRRLNIALSDLYAADTLLLAGKAAIPFNHAKFNAAIKRIFDEKGFSPELLDSPELRNYILETYKALDGAISSSISTETPPELTTALRENAFIFSGFKSYHAMREAGLFLTRSDGSVKSWAEFRSDVQLVDKKYNTNYLFAEYNHAVHASQMAVKWNDFLRDGDRYNLQYRTAGDSRVREAHAALDGVTLPPSDPFWDFYLPPNGWNCRCQTVQVLRDDYPQSDSKAAIAAGEDCTSEPKQQIFRFNPGKQLKIFPPKHPYLPKGCGDCGSRANFAYDPKREACRVCRILNEQQRIERARKLYKRLSKDKKYIDVEFNEQNGGLTATHVGHNTHPNDRKRYFGNLSGDDLENELRNLLFRNGHTVIFCDEQKKKGRNTLPALDMQLDGVSMDIASVTTKRLHYGLKLASKNRQLVKYNARTDVKVPADTVCLYFHDSRMYTPSRITKGLQYMKDKVSNPTLKSVVCVVRKNDGTMSMYRNTLK